MIRRFSLLTIKVVFGITVFNQSISALTLNGKEIHFLKTNNSLQTLSESNKDKTIIVKFNAPLSDSDKSKLYSKGVKNIIYAGDLSYYIYGKSKVLDSVDFQAFDFVGKSEMISDYKFKEDGGISTFADDEYQTFNVLFLQEMNEGEVKEYFKRYEIEADIRKVIPELREAQIEVKHSLVEKLKKLPLIQYLDRNRHMKTVHSENVQISKVNRNFVTSKYINIRPLWSSTYKLNGENMSIGVVDGGAVRDTHKEFMTNGYSRIINKSDVETNLHSTHVAGTITANGTDSSLRGMANKATIYSYAFSDTAFAESFLKLYSEDGVLLSNHSYGYSDKIRLGEYDSDAATQDRAVSNNPFINVFEAAGNDGKVAGYADYGIIKGPGNSKNIFTIGALNFTSTNVAELSSTGPVNDGRIKPDLCVRGERIKSTTDESDTSSTYMSGTSMATPAATGSAALIMQQYRRVTGGFDVRHDVLKSIMVNTAVDKENRGPDYKVGFGMIDVKAAVDVVKTISTKNSLVTVSKVSNSQEKEYNFKLSSASKFKTTLCWVDVEANPSSAKTLVNDLDLLLINKTTGAKYYPYRLDKNNPNALAKNDAPNRVDNIEQIEVSSLPAGEYKLVVKGYQVISSSQEFALTSNMAIFGENTLETLRPSKLKNFVKTIQKQIL